MYDVRFTIYDVRLLEGSEILEFCFFALGLDFLIYLFSFFKNLPKTIGLRVFKATYNQPERPRKSY